jgi:SH3 domain protein
MKNLWLFMILFVSTSAFADKVFIRDVIYVPLRGGQSSEHRILHQGIRSGTLLERTEQNEETGFSRVITPEGLEGWIQTQYLVTEPIARDRLSTLQTRFESLQVDYQKMLESLDSESDAAATAAEEIERLNTRRQELETELSRITELAADTILIDQQNAALQLEVDGLHQQIDDLAVVNGNLQDNATQSWFMIGAGTVFFGLLLGFIVSRQIYSRRASSWA